jgi:hypothetical protein
MSLHFHLSHGHIGKPLGSVCCSQEPVHAEPDQYLHRQPGLRRHPDVLFLCPFHTHPGVDFTNQLVHKVKKGNNIDNADQGSISSTFVRGFFAQKKFDAFFGVWQLANGEPQLANGAQI